MSAEKAAVPPVTAATRHSKVYAEPIVKPVTRTGIESVQDWLMAALRNRPPCKTIGPLVALPPAGLTDPEYWPITSCAPSPTVLFETLPTQAKTKMVVEI